MSNKLEDFFNQLAGEDILQKMKDEEQAKLDEEKKKIAEENEKEIQKRLKEKKEEEKKQFTESQKLKALEQLFGLPKFDEIVKEEVEKVEEEIKPKKSVDEEALLKALTDLTGSVGEYQKKKVIEYDITENDYKNYLKSKPTNDDSVVNDITKLLDQSYIPEQLKVSPPEKELDVKYLNTKKENVYDPLPTGMVSDVKAFIESKVEPQPYMKMNVGDPIQPGQSYVSKDEIYRTLTKRAKSLKEQLENGEIGLEELTKEFSRFKQLTTLQLQSLGGGGAGDLKDLGDVDISAQADGFALKYNATTGKYDFGEVASDLSAVDQNIIPDTDGTRDIGSTAKAFNNGYFKNVYVEGTTLEVDTDTTLKGSTTIGVTSVDSTEDTLTINAKINSSLEPLTTLTHDLGSPNRRWRDIYLSGNTIDLAGATISGDGTGAITISATGATLPVGSKVGTASIAQADAKSGVATRSVNFFTAAGGLSTANTTFTMAATSARTAVFSGFTKADGNQQGVFEIFSF